MVEVNYKYSKGALSQIIRDAGQNSTADSMTYSFTYDSFGNTTSVKVGTYTLATYQYESYNGKLIKTTYGNGDYVQNVYDEFDRLVGIKVNGVSKYTYSYNGNGDIVRIEDVDSGITEWYNYDSLDRLVSSFRKHSSGESICTYYSYDEKGRACRSDCSIAGISGGALTQAYEYTYNESDGSISSLDITSCRTCTNYFI